VTTDLRQRCTEGHTGTSVSAPMVAGVIALALEAKEQFSLFFLFLSFSPLISWRDVQHLLVKTSRQAHLKANDWKTNAAGHKVSHLYGFGLVDAEAMVVEAKKWRTVPPQHTCSKTSDRRTRLFDNSNEGFRNWEFMTVHCWGERAEGTWTLEISDSPSQLRNPEVLGKLKEWTLILHGTAEHPYQSQSSQHSHSKMLENPTADKELKNLDSIDGLLVWDCISGPCHPECGDQGCDGSDADHCLNCIHFSLGSLKSGRCQSHISTLNGFSVTDSEGRTCVSHCPLGYFEDGEARRCRRCHRGCEKCVARGPNECRSCRRGLYFYSKESTCVETCPVGCFHDEGQRRCLKCHENCLKCSRDADRCTACKDGF
ncbi:hypothetical protein cypCar_00040612, partial [Cyprinus carpio]